MPGQLKIYMDLEGNASSVLNSTQAHLNCLARTVGRVHSLGACGVRGSKAYGQSIVRIREHLQLLPDH